MKNRNTMAFREHHPTAVLEDPLGLLQAFQKIEKHSLIIKWFYGGQLFNCKGGCKMTVAIEYIGEDRDPLDEDECHTTIGYETLIAAEGLQTQFEKAWADYLEEHRAAFESFREFAIENWTEDARAGTIDPDTWQRLVGYPMPEDVRAEGRANAVKFFEEMLRDNDVIDTDAETIVKANSW